MRISYMLFISLSSLLIYSCSGKEDKKEQVAGTKISIGKINPDSIINIDLEQDLGKKSLQELRLLYNSVYARKGYLFMEADLRGFFSAHTPHYDSLMEAPYFAGQEDKSFPAIHLTKAEEVFTRKIKDLEKQKLKENYSTVNGKKIANIENVINLFQYKNLSSPFLNKLKENNFVIVPNNNEQLFHLYEQNDYHQLPNFVTTDLYLQVFHMYFSYLLKALEQEKFIATVSDLTDALYNESIDLAGSATDEKLKSLAEYNAVFYAIPNYILTGKKKNIPARYLPLFESEIKNINEGIDDFSEFLDFKTAFFPYSLFKPRGHYSRSEDMRKYFKAMMWLQTAPFCREKNEQLMQASYAAFLLNTKQSASGKSLLNLYNTIYEPIAFIIGEPDNLSIMDIAAFLKRNDMNDISLVTQASTMEKINNELLLVAKNRNRIKPKIQVSCADKINFMPQRYLLDNEILQELADIEVNAKRAYPKGLDLFAVLGNKTAETILLNGEDEKSWKEYPKKLNALKDKFEKSNDWNKSVYNKWIQSLVSMTKKEENYPPFMQSENWDKKNLNTALASWAELKHDAILYGEQPSGAECGGGGPPDPITVGYVEPNINFWKRITELILLTENLLMQNDLYTEDIASKTKQLKESADFLLSASQKELKGERLTEQEYKTIEVIGSSMEYLTLSILEPNKYLSMWEEVKGPDKSIAVTADIYTRNIRGCDKNGILHVGVGNVNDLFVIVEIEGYLYLTKGATFSFYEFVQPPGVRLTDEQWQKMIEDKKLPPVPEWMEDILLPLDDKPGIDEKVFYSSGC